MNIIKRKIKGRPHRSHSGVDLEVIGQRIRELRGQTTQKEFVRTLRISQAQLSKYELGQSAPPLGFLINLAKESGRSVDWILTGKN